MKKRVSQKISTFVMVFLGFNIAHIGCIISGRNKVALGPSPNGSSVCQIEESTESTQA